MLTKPLYPYQDKIVNKFLGRGNLLLAADVGTGKTPMSLGCAEELFAAGKIGMCLIVCPSSLRLQWAQQIARWTDVETTTRKAKGEVLVIPTRKHCIIVDGDEKRRVRNFTDIFTDRPEYVIISYEQVLSDWQDVRAIGPGLIILDEATIVKNPAAQRTKAIKELTAEYRLALTATAVENAPEEVFAIMDWVDDTVLGRFDLFDATFIVRNAWGAVKRYKNLNLMHKRLTRAMARVTNTDPEVAPYMPKVKEHLWEVKLDPATRAVYQTVAGELLTELEDNPPAFGQFNLWAHYHGEADENTAVGRIMARQQALQQLLNHPDLLRNSEGKYAQELTASGLLDDLSCSPKQVRVGQGIQEILEADPANKVIVFSGYRGMIALLSEMFEHQHVVYHGEMSINAKAASAAAFNNNPEVRLLFSSHAGAYGLDLPAANWHINYDLAWSHGKQTQINGRSVRAASKHKVTNIVDVMVLDTIEPRRRAVVRHKGKISAAILDGVGTDADGVLENDVVSLTESLRASLDA